MTIRNWLTKWFGCAFKKAQATLPKVPDIVTPPVADRPATGTTDHIPDATKGCGCDLSKPRAVFGVPVLGATESKVGGWLRARWASGTDDSCGGLPHDVRPRAICPSGKSFGWKYAITKGFIGIRFEGNNMALSCGDVTVDGLVQRWHFVGTSDHTSREGWKDCKPGEWTPIAKHAWFEIRNK